MRQRVPASRSPQAVNAVNAPTSLQARRNHKMEDQGAWIEEKTKWWYRWRIKSFALGSVVAGSSDEEGMVS
jgi:hypothetical protein